jgi:hypothetical protein
VGAPGGENRLVCCQKMVSFLGSARVITDFFSSVLGGQDRIFQARLDFSKNKIILTLFSLVEKSVDFDLVAVVGKIKKSTKSAPPARDPWFKLANHL